VEEEEYRILGEFISDCRSWGSELVCLSYFLSRSLERKEKAGDDCQVILKRAFELTSEMWLLIQQFDSKFIKYLFRHVRNQDESLEGDLIGIQQNLSQHIYE
jgi:hypothetical protein